MKKLLLPEALSQNKEDMLKSGASFAKMHSGVRCHPDGSRGTLMG